MLELSGNSSPKGKVLREPFKVELKESRESCSSYVKKGKLRVGGEIHSQRKGRRR